MELTPHPALALFRSLSDVEYAELRADIERYGQRTRVFRQRNHLLDGRSRERACLELGLEVQYEEYSGDAVSLIASLNLNGRGRQLDTEERLVVAVRLLKMGAGRPKKSDRSRALTRREVSHLTTQSEAAVARAKIIVERGAPELVEAFTKREIAGTTAAEFAARHSQAKQRELIEKARNEQRAGAKLALARTSSTVRANPLQLQPLDVAALSSLAQYGWTGGPECRAGVKVLQRIVPEVARE